MSISLQAESMLPDSATLDRMTKALGVAIHTPYAPPHVYPMSVPNFETAPALERPASTHDALGLYVHIPFCNYACNFCFYTVRAGDSRAEMEPYVRALCRELEWVRPNTRLTQLYVGGGTPTALPADLLDETLRAIFARFTRGGELIHTVEGSPESISAEHLSVLRAHGIGRVSMGIQSLDQEVLSRVRRCHSSDDALAACERVLQQGFLLNVDLIFGLPGQTEESFARDFERLVERGVSSISVYNLRINERTPVLRILGREEHLEFLQLVRWRTLVQKLARAARFEQPRWHTFARPVDSSTVRFEDRTGSGDQLGIGVSARSRLGSTIYRNNTRIKTYLERIDAGQSPVEEILRLGNEEHGVRFITQTLGVGRALERAAYQRSLGRRFDDDFGPTLSRLHEAGLLIDDGERVELSSTGRLVHDLITLAFYPEQMRDWLRKRHLAALDRFAVPA